MTCVMTEEQKETRNSKSTDVRGRNPAGMKGREAVSRDIAFLLPNLAPLPLLTLPEGTHLRGLCDEA